METKPSTITCSIPGKLHVAALFTGTIFVSAALLFFVQPMFSKLVLPHLGGAPSVWTTAMLFFQVTLIGGYAYAHALIRYLSPTAQLIIHITFWLAALFFLPIQVPSDWSLNPAQSTTWQVLMVFGLGVGVPFAMLSANAPLIQAWYARSDGPSAHDPYFLYAASNLGSLIALLAFPLLAEPFMGARSITLVWSFGFVGLGLGLMLTGLAARNGRKPNPVEKQDIRIALCTQRVLWWLLASFLPSALMLSVTSAITAEIGAFPLIWIIPLSLYLLSFVLAFSTSFKFTGQTLEKLFLASYLLLLILAADDMTGTIGWTWFFIIIAAFFIVALYGHRRLYESRPATEYLTQFYVVIAIGGALGGVFNAILAPMLFSGAYEQPILAVLTGLLLIERCRSASYRDLRLGLGLGIASLLVLVLLVRLYAHSPFAESSSISNSLPAKPEVMLTLALAIGLAISLRKRPFALVIAAALWMAAIHVTVQSVVVFEDRSFFGAYRVEDRNSIRLLRHGSTVHGAQSLPLSSMKPIPQSYYHPNGPLGQILSSAKQNDDRTIGVIGLGVGALACYHQPEQEWHFYEIDPLIDQIARNSDLFGYMRSCSGDAPTHLGDARIQLTQQHQRIFDILVIDAYTGDSVPLHLMTMEAIQIYLDHLAEDGLLVFHTSSRFYQLEKPLARAAKAKKLIALQRTHPLPGVSLAENEHASMVVVLARSVDAIAQLIQDSRWRALESDGGPIWTDDYTNLLGIIQ